MITTFQALLIAAIAILPGSVYTIARESRGASWAWRSTDAATLLFRFLTASAFFHLLLAPIGYTAYQHVVVDHLVAPRHPFPWAWWGWLAGYIILPYLFGLWMEAARSWKPSPRRVLGLPKNLFIGLPLFVAGRANEPRAWDRLFTKNRTGYIILRLKDSDEWKAGIWYEPSYASAYGEDKDLYIAEQIAVNDDGSVAVDQHGNPQYLGVGLLISWSELNYVEFVEE
ncbi:hypothetical protein BZL29_7861 [Mycobacterium kansasii]|uniref:Uncharacterized protein n=1 Tax=Mycobacterium kansasii TaxID=1768 RepID=A0A1V3WEH2_MYCKA|nr:hypothetical protein BZL29_7861 [Mycobacterium kansasii]